MIVPINKIKLINQGLETLVFYMTEEELDLILLAIKIAAQRLELEKNILH